MTLEPGSRLVLYTDGLVENRELDINDGLDRLQHALGHTGRSSDQTCTDVLEALLPEQPLDDIALLVATTRTLDPDRIAQWDVPADPAAVAPVRAECVRRLHQWGLEEIAFTVELILSELITNAVRYGTPPITVRLLHDEIFTCEVSDASSTAPMCVGRAPSRKAAAASSWSPNSPSAGAPATHHRARPSGRN